jgi:hypothetical protein
VGITSLIDPGDSTFTRTTITFEEIVDRMAADAVFAFDPGALEKFMANAMLHGLCLAADPEYVPNELDIHLTRISLIPD